MVEEAGEEIVVARRLAVALRLGEVLRRGEELADVLEPAPASSALSAGTAGVAGLRRSSSSRSAGSGSSAAAARSRGAAPRRRAAPPRRAPGSPRAGRPRARPTAVTPASRARPLEHRLRGLADAARRHVDDARQRELSRGLRSSAQVGEQVLDLGAVVEAQAADDGVGDAGGRKRLLDARATGRGCGRRRRSRRAACLGARRRGSPRRPSCASLALVARRGAGDRLAARRLGPERLALRARLWRDDARWRPRGWSASSGSCARA